MADSLRVQNLQRRLKQAKATIRNLNKQIVNLPVGKAGTQSSNPAYASLQRALSAAESEARAISGAIRSEQINFPPGGPGPRSTMPPEIPGTLPEAAPGTLSWQRAQPGPADTTKPGLATAPAPNVSGHGIRPEGLAEAARLRAAGRAGMWADPFLGAIPQGAPPTGGHGGISPEGLKEAAALRGAQGAGEPPKPDQPGPTSETEDPLETQLNATLSRITEMLHEPSLKMRARAPMSPGQAFAAAVLAANDPEAYQRTVVPALEREREERVSEYVQAREGRENQRALLAQIAALQERRITLREQRLARKRQEQRDAEIQTGLSVAKSFLVKRTQEEIIPQALDAAAAMDASNVPNAPQLAMQLRKKATAAMENSERMQASPIATQPMLMVMEHAINDLQKVTTATTATLKQDKIASPIMQSMNRIGTAVKLIDRIIAFQAEGAPTKGTGGWFAAGFPGEKIQKGARVMGLSDSASNLEIWKAMLSALTGYVAQPFTGQALTENERIIYAGLRFEATDNPIDVVNRAKQARLSFTDQLTDYRQQLGLMGIDYAEDAAAAAAAMEWSVQYGLEATPVGSDALGTVYQD